MSHSRFFIVLNKPKYFLLYGFLKAATSVCPDPAKTAAVW